MSEDKAGIRGSEAGTLESGGCPGEARRLAYLSAMGIDVWVPRLVGTRGLNSSAAGATPENLERSRQVPTPFPRENRSLSDPVRASRPHASSPSHPSPARGGGLGCGAAGADVAQLDWDALEKRVAGCTLCGLHTARTQTVFGVGSHTADWLFIGEAPGRDEDAQGEPFVGRAGQLLNSMLHAVGLSREQVYIANILKCRPPKNRDPKPEEALACEPYLKRQIELLEPRIIIALGRIAAQNLLHTDTPIGRMRGRQYVYGDTGIPLLVTYHPAYLLRSPLEKRKAWEDLLRAKKLVQSD
ncbi:MAG: uracil-DNA glycosylase [Gammaproteobacteria bacterium]